MRRTDTDVRAALDRAAAAMVLRDRAMEVAGVHSVRVRAGRRRADVRAVSHFRALDDVRQDLDAVLQEAVRALGLARPLALSVHVRRPGRKG
jgi:predicted membrane chloride channel (bestrophin family)